MDVHVVPDHLRSDEENVARWYSQIAGRHASPAELTIVPPHEERPTELALRSPGPCAEEAKTLSKLGWNVALGEWLRG